MLKIERTLTGVVMTALLLVGCQSGLPTTGDFDTQQARATRTYRRTGMIDDRPAATAAVGAWETLVRRRDPAVMASLNPTPVPTPTPTPTPVPTPTPTPVPTPTPTPVPTPTPTPVPTPTPTPVPTPTPTPVPTPTPTPSTCTTRCVGGGITLVPVANAGLDFLSVSGTEVSFKANVTVSVATSNVSFRTARGSIYTPTRMEVGGVPVTAIPAGTTTLTFFYDPGCFPYDTASEGGWTLVIDGYDVGYQAFPSGILAPSGRYLMCV